MYRYEAGLSSQTARVNGSAWSIACADVNKGQHTQISIENPFDTHRNKGGKGDQRKKAQKRRRCGNSRAANSQRAYVPRLSADRQPASVNLATMFRRPRVLMGRLPHIRYSSSNSASSNNSHRVSSRLQPRQPGSSFRPRRGSTASPSHPQATGSSNSNALTHNSNLPSVPILSTDPSIIVSDAFFAGDRPLLELAVPPSQRQSAVQDPRQSLDEMLDEALQWFDPRKQQQQPSSSTKPAPAKTVAAEAQAELEKQTPFVSPQEPERRKLSFRRRRLAPRHGQAQHFLQTMHQRLDHADQDARLALDKFFAAGQKLSEVLPSAKASSRRGRSPGKGKVLTAEDVQELLQITSAAMEHWSADSGSAKLFTMEKDPQSGVWTSTENSSDSNALAPSEPASPFKADDASAAQDELEESDLLEDHVIVLDQHGRQQFIGGVEKGDYSSSSNSQDAASSSSLAQAISHFVRNLPEDVALERQQQQHSHQASSRKPGQRPLGGMGRRITLGPRLSATRGVRAVPRVHRTLEQLLGWTGIRADSVKKKRKRKVRCCASLCRRDPCLV